MIVLAASRVESRRAGGTPRLTPQILSNRHLHPASPAQNRPRIPFRPRPNRNRVPGQLLMTILASPVHPATSHLDRHDIQLGAPVRTTRLRVHFDAAHLLQPFIGNVRSPFLSCAFLDSSFSFLVCGFGLSLSANPYPAPGNPASATSPPPAPYDETHASQRAAK